MTDSFEELEFGPQDYFRRAEPEDIFPDSEGPLELDLGSGDGSFLIRMAKEYPEHRFLGVERLLGRVRKVSRRARRANLENLRVLRLDSSYAVEWLLPRDAFHRVHLLFPDPWPKKKHHRRRIVTPAFVQSVRKLLAPGGEFLFRTDHEEYFGEAAATILAAEGMTQLPWEGDEFFYAETDFERLWKSEGKRIQEVRMRRDA